MPNYVVLFKYTKKGIENVKESPNRIDAAKRAFEAKGAKVKDWYLLMGRYDTIFIAEAPDDETMAELMLALGSLGNVKSETLRAFTEAEFRRIAGNL